MAKTNKLRTQTKPKTKPSTTKKKTKRRKNKKKQQITITRKQLNTALKILGGFLVLFSIFLFFAFTSFLFAWDSDISTVHNFDKFMANMHKEGVEVENWMGTIGAYLSYVFVYRWFGIAAYILIPLFFASQLAPSSIDL